MTDHMKFYLSKENSMYFNHEFGVSPIDFKNNSNLDNFFNVIT